VNEIGVEDFFFAGFCTMEVSSIAVRLHRLLSDLSWRCPYPVSNSLEVSQQWDRYPHRPCSELLVGGRFKSALKAKLYGFSNNKMICKRTSIIQVWFASLRKLTLHRVQVYLNRIV
jgi:hypothetical protein